MFLPCRSAPALLLRRRDQGGISWGTAPAALFGGWAGHPSTMSRTVTVSPTASPSARRTAAFTGTM